MEAKFTYISLDEITSKIGSGATPRGGDESYKESGISLIRSLNVYDFSFSYKNLAYIDDNQAGKLKNVTVLANDILLNITGASVGRCCIVPDDVLPARVNQHVAIIRINESIAVPQYVYYVINSRSYKDALLNLSQTGATREALTKDDLSCFKIPLPLLKIQQQIAAILSAYDDLIETNNQRIATLEQLAQQIYKEWFVRMRFPGWEHTPFHHGIPDGWEAQEIKDSDIQIIDGDRGKSYPNKSEFSETGFCLFLNTGNIKDDKFVFNQCEFISEDKDYQLRKGKLQRGDIVLTTRGTVGNLAYYHQGISIENIRINSGMIILRCGSGIGSQFLYQLLKSQTMKEQYMLYSSGAAQPQLPIRDFNRIKTILPPNAIQEKFSDLVDPIFEQMGTLSTMNANAVLTRNLLLPRLISGKLTLKQAHAGL